MPTGVYAKYTLVYFKQNLLGFILHVKPSMMLQGNKFGVFAWLIAISSCMPS